MKFEKSTGVKGAFIPRSALVLCGFAEDETATLHTLPGAAILLKKRMTAMEMIQAVDALSQISTDLLTELATVCGPCDEFESEGCPYEETDGPIDLPDYLREEAGIPKNAKLCAEVNEGEKSVIIYATDHQHDLTDIPKGLLPLLGTLGICLGELEQKLITGEVVHDG